MPSLRRTQSSSTVRAAPYSSSLLAARGNGGHRRASGSETSTRRVLADIEWWRVTDGQCDNSADQENEDQNRGATDLVVFDDVEGSGTTITVVDVDAGLAPSASMPASTEVSSEASEYALPTEQFSGLSITPHTPMRRHHRLESSASSLESTPEATPEVPLEGLALGMSDMDMGFFEASSLPPLSTQRQHRFDMLTPILMRPFMSTEFALFDDEPTTTPYADFAVSPLSSAPDFLN